MHVLSLLARCSQKDPTDAFDQTAVIFALLTAYLGTQVLPLTNMLSFSAQFAVRTDDQISDYIVKPLPAGVRPILRADPGQVLR